MRTSPTLVVLAAGIGRRFGGLKQLEPLGPSGETLMEYSIYDALRAGFGRIAIVVRAETRDAFRDTIEARVAPYAELSFVLQALDDLPGNARVPAGRTRPWGTGHAVLACRDLLERVGGRFAVVNADDFYGTEAFRAVAVVTDPSTVALAGYRLRDTLPAMGTVSRALCRVGADNRLASIEEILAIERNGDDGRYVTDDGTVRDVPGDTPVSMNLWGCPQGLLAALDERFGDFLSACGKSLDAEFLLPRVVDDLLRTGRMRVQVVDAPGPWCGVTRPADRERTRKLLGALVDAGVYPRRLWN